MKPKQRGNANTHVKPDDKAQHRKHNEELIHAFHGLGTTITLFWVAPILTLAAIYLTPFKDTFMIPSTPKGIILAAAVTITGLTWIGAAIMIHKLPPPKPPKPSPMRVSKGKPQLLFGSGPKASRIGINPNGAPQGLVGLGNPSDSPVKFFVEDGVLKLDFMIDGGDGKSPVHFKDNELKVTPPGWDSNYTDKVLEVVNKAGEPVLQVIQKNETTIIVNGRFHANGFWVVADEEGGAFSYGEPPRPSSLKPLFKYPSWKHQGEFVD